MLRIFIIFCVSMAYMHATELFIFQQSPRLGCVSATLPDWVSQPVIKEEQFSENITDFEEMPMRPLQADPLYCKELLNKNPEPFVDSAPSSFDMLMIVDRAFRIKQHNERIKEFIQRHRATHAYYLKAAHQQISILEKMDILDIYFLGKEHGIASSHISNLLGYSEDIVQEVVNDYLIDFRRRRNEQNTVQPAEKLVKPSMIFAEGRLTTIEEDYIIAQSKNLTPLQISKNIQRREQRVRDFLRRNNLAFTSKLQGKKHIAPETKEAIIKTYFSRTPPDSFALIARQLGISGTTACRIVNQYKKTLN